MSEREHVPPSIGPTEIAWSAVVTAIGALVAFSMGQPGGEAMEAAAMVLVTLAAAQAMVVVVSALRRAGRGRSRS